MKRMRKGNNVKFFQGVSRLFTLVISSLQSSLFSLYIHFMGMAGQLLRNIRWLVKVGIMFANTFSKGSFQSLMILALQSYTYVNSGRLQ